MLHLANRNVGPPGSFRYHVKELGDKAPTIAWVGPFHAFSDLMREVEKRCRANGIHPPSESEVEDQMCQHLPPGHCRDEDNLPTSVNGSMALTLRDAMEGTRTVFSWWKNGAKRVSKDEIVRRSYICNACPNHVPLTGCQGCSGASLRNLISEIIADTSLPTDSMLQGCSVCKCGLRGKVRIPLEDIVPHMSKDKMDRLWEKCWILEGA